MSTRLGGRYQLVRELGAGGMGRVFQAVDTETGRAVAAKIMLATSEDNLDALLRFQQEGAVLSTLKHPNIVEVYGTFLEEHTSCIIMELLEGQSLSQMLRAERLSLPRIKKLAEQTTSALAYAHGRAIVHRDVKPDNIMVVGDDHVKVTDFGIARILRTGATLNTATGMSIGTPLYMAPEQIEGQKVDGRADIYSFGAVLYQMVTGQPPFEGDDPLTIAFKHVHKEPRKPKELATDVPDDWENIILKCLAKDPGERFQTAAALHDAIAQLSAGPGEQATKGPTVVPRTPTPPPGPRKPDTIAGIINPEITGKPRKDEPFIPTGFSASTPTGFSPGATVIGVPDAGQTVLGPANGGQAVLGPAPGETVVGPMNGNGWQQGTTIQPNIPYPQPQPGPRPDPFAMATPVVPPVTPAQERKRPVALMAGGGVLAALLVAGGAFALFGHGSNNKSTTKKNTTTTIASAALKLSVSGKKAGGAYASGSSVALSWSGASARKYNLEVARNAAFIEATTYTTTKPSKSLPVFGVATYYTKVRALSGGKWGPWTSPLSFAVAKPAIGKTHIVSPKNGSSSTKSVVHIAWTAVKGAVSYVFTLPGHKATLHATSTSVSLKPGSYRACVAPQVKGTDLYTGSRACAHFGVKAKPKKKQTASKPAQQQPVQQQPVQQQPVQQQPVQQQPVQQQPVQQQPVQQQPVQQQPVQQQPVQQQPAQQQPVQQQPSQGSSNPCNPTC